MIIAVCGPKGSGKDTVADLIRTFTNDEFEKCKFVQPMIDWIKHIYDLKSDGEYDRFKRSLLYDEEDNVYDGRRIVRETGMLMRKLDVDFGVKHITEQISKHKNIVISDLRMVNELIFLRQSHIDLIIIKVKLLNQPTSKDDHITEVGIQDKEVDYILLNELGNIDLLKQQIKEVLNETYYKSEIHNNKY